MIDYINTSFMPMNNEKLNVIWNYFYLNIFGQSMPIEIVWLASHESMQTNQVALRK